MVERSRPWSGTVLGDSGPYSDDQWTDVWKAFAPILASQGVLRDQLNELDLSSVAASPVSVNTGRAYVNGIWYESDAAVSVAIPTPAANPRVDRIVLRADWALQTVRVFRIAGAEGASPVPPALVQVDGTTWDLPLWQVHATVGAVLTFFRDERVFVGQNAPIGPTATRVYMATELYSDPTPANGDHLEMFEVNEVGASTVTQLQEAGFGSGALTFDHDGAGTGDQAGISCAYFKPDIINAELTVRLESPDGGDGNMDMVMGFASLVASLVPADAVYFRVNGDGGVTNWEAVTRAGAVETTTDTAQAPDATWREFKIRQHGSDVVTFLIDGVVVATHRANIPSDVVLFLTMQAFDDGAAPAAGDYLAIDTVLLEGLERT